MATAWLDVKGIMAAIRAGERDALEEIGERIAADAKRRAPIRKVFKEPKGYRRRFRSPTSGELAQATQRAGKFYGVNPGYLVGRENPRRPLRFYEARVQLARPGSNNTLARSRKLRLIGTIEQGRFRGIGGTTRNGRGYNPGDDLKSKLTSRGRYEVRSGRAIHIEPTAKGLQVRVGGALKASIGSEGVRQTGRGMEVEVTAAIGYAKFVEFPTIRTAAQPFLLPALMGERDKIPRTIADAIGKRLGG